MSSLQARLLAGASFALLLSAPSAMAQQPGGNLAPEYVIVNGSRGTDPADPASADATIAAARAQEQVNTVNTEDMLKYAPSLLVRKRHYGDNQDPIATRTSGVGASARNLVFVDGILVSAPIGNNNTSASPHFGVAAPHDISRIDILYGPFSARYAGNSMGVTLNIVTHMPDHFELYADITGAAQNFRQYGTAITSATYQLAGGIGDRAGRFSWRLSANHLDSHAQPLGYAELTRPAAAGSAGTVLTGAFDGRNRSGAAIAVLGATGLEHQLQDTATLKLAYDFEDATLSYIASLFRQDDHSGIESYLRDPAGAAVYTGNADIGGYDYNIGAQAFSNSIWNIQQAQLAQGLKLASAPGGDFSWALIVSRFDYLNDKQRVPTTALPAAFSGGPGTVNRLNGTGWMTYDADAAWRGWNGHEISFGLHRDAETYAQRRNGLSDWITGGLGGVAASASGRTATNAVWAQDIWTITPDLKASLGGRYEDWHAYDGTNVSAAPSLNVRQPEVRAGTFSPKATISWQVSDPWRLTASYGQAWRMPTVMELYQAVTTGPTLSVPNPKLKPEHANDYELAAQYRTGGGLLRLSLFQQDVADALLSQSAPLVPGSATLYSYVQNVDRVRVRGFELVADQYDVIVPGLELSGSITYADGRTVADAAFPAAIDKFIPQLPKWRANAVATWRPDDNWSFTLGGRYSDRSFGTIDNSDPASRTYQGFGGYFVLDARAQYRLDRNWTLSAGIDNLNNDKYFLYHPFPQRTVLMEIHYAQ
jgi:iron complex outermembrane receptor protein